MDYVAEAIHKRREECAKFNPRPKGKMVETRTTKRVYAYLTVNNHRCLEPKELIKALNSTNSAVSWALRFLEANELLCSYDHPDRPGYRLYQAV